MHLLALVEDPEHVCCRYRLSAFRPFLEDAGHSLELLAWPRAWWARLRIGNMVRHADAVILQRKLLPRWQLHVLRRSAKTLLFDFDDAVFLRDSYAPNGLISASRRRSFAAVARCADAVIAGNAFLAENAARYAGANAIAVIPTCVSHERYPVAEHRLAGEGVQLVWVGSSSTLRGLEMIRPLLETIGQHCPGVHLKLVCDRFLNLQQLPVIPCQWSEERETQDIAAADIGISWLPDDDWSRGKCGLKVLQYMAAGLPVVANPVGVQKSMIRHGETGFLAETLEEWQQAIQTLANDPALRRRMGQAGRQRVQAEFSVAHGASLWIGLLDRLARAEKRGAA